MIRRYLRLHRQNLLGALGRIGHAPVGASLNVLVIAIALALPTAMQVLLANADNMSPAFENAADFTVFLKLDVGEDAGRDLSTRIAARDDVESTRFISNIEGLAELRARAGFGGALDALTENPLPHVIKVRPTREALDHIDSLADALSALEETDFVQIDRLWIERLQSILRLGRRIVGILTVVLAAAVALVIGNTIRLEINNRQTEIEVQKLVGATDGFIRRPFLYTGLWLGAIGGLTAAVLIAIGLALLARPVHELAALYSADFALAGLSLEGLALLVGGGAVLGWAGAWIAAARHLKAIEPA